MKKGSNIRVGITMGDPAGIGPELCAKAITALGRSMQLVVIGDKGVFDKGARGQRHQVTRVEFIDLKNVNLKKFQFGRIRAAYGTASVEYLDKAMELVKQGGIDCIVTCPISKEAVNRAGYHYAGHTEYFACKAGAPDCVMMLINKDLRFSLVTRHIPLARVSASLTEKKIVHTARMTYTALQDLFAIRHPRLVVCGINPHGSDNGIIGSEENRVIRPAVAALRKKISHIDGPLGADVAIERARKKAYDGVIAMYHDQALIPLKLLGDETGINLTLGLGFVRTSPLHGTAFDIAGKDKADPASLIAAIKLAYQCALNRKKA